MTNTNSSETLSFNTSAELLTTIFPSENWSRFLAKDFLGLTDGHAAIPFHETANGVWYLIDDLERFALAFGKGTPSAGEITAISNKYMVEQAEQKLDDELDQLLGDMDKSGESRDSFLKTHRDADRGVLLSPGEMFTVFRAIDEIAEEQQEVGYILTTLGRAFGALDCGDGFSSTDITALSSVADANARRLAKNGERTRSLFNVLHACPAQPAIQSIKENKS